MGEINYELEKKRYKKFYMHLVESGIVEKPFDEDSYDDYIFDGFSGLLALEEGDTSENSLHKHVVSNNEVAVCKHVLESIILTSDGVKSECKKCGERY